MYEHNPNNNDKIVYDRIDILTNNIANQYPKSFSTEIINNIIDNLTPESFIINFSLKIWELTPSNLLDINDLVDISLLVQLSYDTYLLFIDMPDICNYTSSIDGFNLAQVQLSIIWFASFLMTQVSEQIFKWHRKNTDSDSRTFLINIGKYFQNRVMTQHFRAEYFQSLSNDLLERRNQIRYIIEKQDKIFYQELISFYFCFFVTKQISQPQYQKDIIDNIDINYYVKLHDGMQHKKRKKNKSANQTKHQCNMEVSGELYQIYNKLYESHLEKKTIGTPFL